MPTQSTPPRIVSRAEWLAARQKHLAHEIEHTHQRDALAAERRELPWVKVEKNYGFEGPDGRVTLTDLFADRSQLIVYHFMFGPGWEEGCMSCSFGMDHIDGMLPHLGARDTAFVAVGLEVQMGLKWRERLQRRFPRVFHARGHGGGPG